ncbi:MAG: polysaccharide pyruvyl transferase family protein, partial [Candidatus Paceibacterota bacterium]
FTNIVDGIPPLNNNKYQNTVCIIPNYKMLDKTTLKGNEYINFYSKLIKFISKSGRNVILLNHEQERDYKLCEAIKKNIGSNIEIISGLNALELKGVIGSCYAVISSRYHGVASALSQNVPCLATSWSHKYELLFKDYGLKNQILKVDDKFEVSSKKIKMLIDVNKNAEMREMLKINGAKLKESTCQMWDFIWSINKGK